jgi:sigma-E factor negative regulatory protein RseB
MRPSFIPSLRRLLSALLCSASTFAGAAAPVESNTQTDLWLNRLAHSMGELNYRGVMSYARDNHLESLRITHGTLNGAEFERLEHLDGQHREVIRRGKQLTCIQLGQRFDLLFHRRLLKEGLAGLDAYYDVQIGKEDRVAGRRAVVVDIAPKDAFRYGYRLALDYDTGLLLRSEALDATGHVLERMQFVEVEIGQPLKKEWLGESAPVANTADDRVAIERVVEEVQMPWHPQWLPAGFMLSVAPHRPSEDVLTYSDGIAVLSVFIESAAASMPQSGGKAMQGATAAYSRPMQLDGKATVVTVVGEVPPETANRVANSVVWDGGS